MARPGSPPEFAPAAILETLARHGVDFVLIGGMATVVRGSARPSFDVDIAYARDRPNLERLATALQELGALDADSLERGSHCAFQTRFGWLDIFKHPAGAPPYAELVRAAGAPELIEGHPIRVASLDHLIAMKEASRRPHDIVAAQELRTISDELRAPDGDS